MCAQLNPTAVPTALPARPYRRIEPDVLVSRIRDLNKRLAVLRSKINLHEPVVLEPEVLRNLNKKRCSVPTALPARRYRNLESEVLYSKIRNLKKRLAVLGSKVVVLEDRLVKRRAASPDAWRARPLPSPALVALEAVAPLPPPTTTGAPAGTSAERDGPCVAEKVLAAPPPGPQTVPACVTEAVLVALWSGTLYAAAVWLAASYAVHLP